MSVLLTVSRRAVLAGKAALAGLAALPGAAFARGEAAGPEALNGAPTAATTGALRPPRWHDATAEELMPLVGDRFRISTPQHGNLVLRLKAVEAGRSGMDRPRHLPRRESVTVVFDSPDSAPLVADGDGLHRVWHPRMGAADLYMTAVPRRSGGADIEIVLN
ncbi:DUF6916 family protein [Mameliella alba]|uniref:DUF6916 family protein n=1 Tax=Mameliella alba TaxID=561184 RepID=UPI000B52F29D|nr:hypothetical protein [Mameliella alba]OWV45592.1 hypothetical protein CDZ95_01105 [Mameliella alba]OWV65663.1 hypothetical protein CDZ97_07245 [Mameliella alba]